MKNSYLHRFDAAFSLLHKFFHQIRLIRIIQGIEFKRLHTLLIYWWNSRDRWHTRNWWWASAGSLE
jgi:hypothetical protein